MTSEYNCRQPSGAAPFVDPATGMMTIGALRWTMAITARTGDSQGIGTTNVQTAATAAQTSATTAQTSATAANAAVAAEAATRATADTTEAVARTAADATERAARIAADALLAPQASPVFTGGITNGIAGPTWTQGAGVPGATAPVGSLYSRTGGAIGSTLYVSRGGGTWLAVAGV